MKKVFLSALIVLMCSYGYSQTNVSGNILSNTTWTLANSPYIVVDSLIVYSGVTLTIEPGVVVKFDDHKYMDIEGNIIANGTIADSITFTSNNPSPTPGIWGDNTFGGIYFGGIAASSAFNFCNISFATIGIYYGFHITYIKNSVFAYNQTGIDNSYLTPVDSCVFKNNTNGIGDFQSSSIDNSVITNNHFGISMLWYVEMNNCRIDSNDIALGGGMLAHGTRLNGCRISHNQSGFISTMGGNLLINCQIDSNTYAGVEIGSSTQDSIINCEIKYNGTGIRTGGHGLITFCTIEYDTIGILVEGHLASIHCNKICNNVMYNMQLTSFLNINTSNNYWCTSDSSQIAASIYDGNDSVGYGLITFLPTDSACWQTTSIPNHQSSINNLQLFPNPTSGIIQLTFNTKHNAPLMCEIINVMGEKVWASPLTPKGEPANVQLDVSFLTKGMYVVRVGDGISWGNRKLVVE